MEQFPAGDNELSFSTTRDTAGNSDLNAAAGAADRGTLEETQEVIASLIRACRPSVAFRSAKGFLQQNTTFRGAKGDYP
jgi:hypothetical protein